MPTDEESKRKPLFFVIMPFNKKVVKTGRAFENIYNIFIKPTLEGLGYNCKKANEVKSGDMLEYILNHLCNDKNYVLADITDNNPNVLYELGVRHAIIERGTIVITQSLEEIPFDLKHHTAVEYSEALDIDDFKKQIKEAIDSTELQSPVFKKVNKYYDFLGELSGWKQKYDEQQEEIEERAIEIAKGRHFDKEMLENIESQIITAVKNCITGIKLED